VREFQNNQLSLLCEKWYPHQRIINDTVSDLKK